jgi:hypothetical protein
MKYKNGDILVCKKTTRNVCDDIVFIKDKSYKLRVYESKNFKIIWICGEEIDIPFNSKSDLKNYFYSVTEYRKKKLRKINGL